MRRPSPPTACAALLAALLLPGMARPAEKPLLRIVGGYLAHSYDFNQTLGQDVTITWGDRTIKARSLKIDLSGRRFVVLGGVEVSSPAGTIQADEFFFSAAEPAGILVRYGPSLKLEAFGAARSTGELEADVRAQRAVLAGVGWEKLRSSLIYTTAKTIEITPAYEVYGTDVTFYVEGIPSVGMARFKLSMGDEARAGGFSLDRVWFSRTQGLFGDFSFNLMRENLLDSSTQLHYEEHSLLGDYQGLPRQLDLRTSTTWAATGPWKLGLEGNFSSTGLWNARIFLGVGDPAADGLTVDAAYRKPLRSRGETWFGARSRLSSSAWGNLFLQARYELHGQTLASLAYDKTFGKRLSFRLKTDYSHILFGDGAAAARIFTAGATASYDADPFQAAADYYLNSDLLGGQRLSRPQLRVSLRPVAFYGGLLSFALSDVLVLNSLRGGANVSESYNSNAVFSLGAAPVRLGSGLILRLILTAEQFLEKEGRNFSTGGAVVRAAREFAPGVTLEAIYGFQSRRRTRSWLIEGTTSQDLTFLFRVTRPGRLEGWISAAYDPKHGDWKQGFADVSVGLVRNWKFQTLLNYDFYRRTLANIDLYLVRRVGRFDLRFVWRSLSKQLLIELVPGGEPASPVRS
jgi:hypothetical protein